MRRDFVVYVIVLVLSLVAGAEMGIGAGVVLSWILTLALPYSQTVPVHVVVAHQVAQTPAQTTPAASLASAGMAPLPYLAWSVLDASEVGGRRALVGSDSSTPSPAVAVMDFRHNLLYAVADKLKVC